MEAEVIEDELPRPRFTRSKARTSETGACLTDLLKLNTERVIELTNKV